MSSGSGAPAPGASSGGQRLFPGRDRACTGRGWRGERDPERAADNPVEGSPGCSSPPQTRNFIYSPAGGATPRLLRRRGWTFFWQGQVRRRHLRETLPGESRGGRGRLGWVSERKPPLRASELGAGRCPASLLPTPPQGPGGGGLPLPAPGWPPLLVPSTRPRGAPRGTSALSRLPEGAAPPHVPGSWQVALMLRMGWLPRSCYRVGLPPKPKIVPVPGPPGFQTRKIRFRCSWVLAAAKCFLFERDQPALCLAIWRASCLARLTWGMRFSSQHMLPEGTCLSF